MSGGLRNNWDEVLDALDDAAGKISGAMRRRQSDQAEKIREDVRRTREVDARLSNGVGDVDSGGVDRIDTGTNSRSERDHLPHGMSPDEYARIRESSVHNVGATEAVLGKYSVEGTQSYVDFAEDRGARYFSLGDNWNSITKRYDLEDKDMFELFNIPFLDDAIRERIDIRLSHDPRDFKGSALWDEYLYLDSHDYVLDESTMTMIYVGGDA